MKVIISDIAALRELRKYHYGEWLEWKEHSEDKSNRNPAYAVQKAIEHDRYVKALNDFFLAEDTADKDY